MYTIYDGPSMLDGQSIIVLLTGVQRASNNPKTGPMAQTWILRRDRHPSKAVNDGSDASICGDCVHRNGSCYVATGLGPSAVWKAWRDGKYGDVSPVWAGSMLAAIRPHVRIGAYGDPAAAPTWVWTQLVSVPGVKWTGYTHQWRHSDPELRHLCMASVESPEERTAAQQAGWRTFRVRLSDEPVDSGEFQCPASDEMGHRTTCQQCLKCSGAHNRKDITIIVHGSGNKPDVFEQLRQRVAEAS